MRISTRRATPIETKNWFYTDAANYGDRPDLFGVQVLSGYEIRATNSRDIRDGVTGTLEWKPSDAVHSVLDLYYSRFKQDTTTRGVEGPTAGQAWTGDPTTFSNVQTKNIGGAPFEISDHVNNAVPGIRWDDNHASRPSLLRRTEQRFPDGGTHASTCRPFLFVQQA